MVELALVAPLLLLLVGGAVDFGRVFFSWVQLTNSARVAANYAALHPTAWGTPGNLAEQANYATLIGREAEGMPCELPSPLPAPTFPGGKTVGADARVAMACDFTLLTPFMGMLFSNPFTISASAVFPITAGCVGCPPAPVPTPLPSASPTPSPPPCGIVPDLAGLTVASARSTWAGIGFTGGFSPSNGSDTDLVVGQTTVPASNPGGCILMSASVTVTTTPAPSASPSCGTVPNMFGVRVRDARDAWGAAGFTGSFTPSNGSNNDTVLSQTTNPASIPGDCVSFSTTVVVTHGPPPTPAPTPTPPPCIVPSFVGTPSANAQGTWTLNGFSTSVSFQKPNKVPYTVQFQSIVGGSSVPCSANITLGPS